MPTVSAYSSLKKNGVTFTALRAVGLAVEEGHRFCRNCGLGRLSQGSVSKVSISGGLVQVKHGDGWRKVPSCTLELASRDSTFALAIVQKHRALFTDLGLNLWEVDLRIPRGLGSYDLVADFSTQRNFGVLGHVWVELKVISANGFDRRLREIKEALASKLEQVRAANAAIEAVMLVAVRARRDGRVWQSPLLVAQLLLVGGAEWKTLAGQAPTRIPRGRADPTAKPSLPQVWGKVEWVTHPQTEEKVGYLKHFLRALNLPADSLKKRAKAFNKILEQSGCADRVRTARLPGKCGSRPWLASKDVLRRLYGAL